MSDNARGLINVSVPLSNVAVKYSNDATKYIADKILPLVSVAKQAGLHYTFGNESFRLYDDLRANGAPSSRVLSYSTGTAAYYTDTRSLHDVVTEEDRSNADGIISPEITTTENLVDMRLVRREYDVAAALFNTTTFSGYTAALSGTDLFDDYTNSDPIGKLSTARENVRGKIGRPANTLVIGAAVFNALKQHPDILDRIKYTQTGILTPALLAALLDVSQVLIGEGIYESTNQKQSSTLTDIWGKFALMCYVAQGSSPNLKKPSLGYIPQWNLYGGGPYMTKKWYDDALSGDVIEVTSSYDIVVAAAAAGYLYSTVIA